MKSIRTLRLALSCALLFLIFSGNEATAQVRDTVVVYDTLYVYDTIRVKIDKPIEKIEKAVLEIDTISSIGKLILINWKKTATIPIHRIIISDNMKNFSKMKRIGWFGTMLMVMNNALFAQTNFGLSTGFTVWGQSLKEEGIGIEDTIAPGMSLGFFGERKITDKLALRLGVDYGFLKGSKKVNTGVPQTFDMVNPFFRKDYHQFSVPLRIVWFRKKFRPSIGVFWSGRYTTTRFIDVDNILLAGVGEKYRLSTSYIGGVLGFSYPMSSRVLLDFLYKASWYTNGVRVVGDNPEAFNNTYGETEKTTGHQLTFAISYTFKNMRRE